jgi:hypothetical protein
VVQLRLFLDNNQWQALNLVRGAQQIFPRARGKILALFGANTGTVVFVLKTFLLLAKMVLSQIVPYRTDNPI